MAAGVVAVTGATGFLGRRLVPELMARRWRVRVLSRRTPERDLWGGLEPDVVRGDLADPYALQRLVAGCDVVVHAAGLIKALSRAAFDEVNVEGARRTAEAASAAGARMLLVSSLAAREPRLSDYSASKALGEAAAKAVLAERVVVLRPPAIYGPGDRETLALFRLAASSPVLPLPAPDANRLAIAHVDDVIESLIALLAPSAPAGTWAVGGARPAGYGFREVLGTAAETMGRKPALVPVPAAVLRAAAAASGLAGRLSGQAAIFSGGKAREVLHADWSVTPAEQAPGAAPARFDLREGFASTVAWYRANGWLN
jgi:nucleoside-diphosphate-sugar epimerase